MLRCMHLLPVAVTTRFCKARPPALRAVRPGPQSCHPLCMRRCSCDSGPTRVGNRQSRWRNPISTHRFACTADTTQTSTCCRFIRTDHTRTQFPVPEPPTMSEVQPVSASEEEPADPRRTVTGGGAGRPPKRGSVSWKAMQREKNAHAQYPPDHADLQQSAAARMDRVQAGSSPLQGQGSLPGAYSDAAYASAGASYQAAAAARGVGSDSVGALDDGWVQPSPDNAAPNAYASGGGGAQSKSYA